MTASSRRRLVRFRNGPWAKLVAALALFALAWCIRGLGL